MVTINELEKMSTNDLITLNRVINEILQKRSEYKEEVTRARNEMFRKVREKMREANCTAIKAWQKQGDRRIYLNWERGKIAFGSEYASTRYPITSTLYLDANAYHDAGWEISPSELKDKIPQLLDEILAMLGETAESFVAKRGAIYCSDYTSN